ncbi:MAG TPA: hypothetical protein VGM53_05370 [Streptosporangiaceae bacterium]
MRPPDCFVCHLTLGDVPDDGRDYFTLVYFGETKAEKMAPAQVLADTGRSGHPSNAVWFSNGHLPLAQQHEDRHVSDALDAIKAESDMAPADD